MGQLVLGAPGLGEGHIEVPGRGHQQQALGARIHRRQNIHIAAGECGNVPEGVAAAEVEQEPLWGALRHRQGLGLLLGEGNRPQPAHAFGGPLIAPGVGKAQLVGLLQQHGPAGPLLQGVRQGEGCGIFLHRRRTAQGLLQPGHRLFLPRQGAKKVSRRVRKILGRVIGQHIDGDLPLGSAGLGHLVQGPLGLTGVINAHAHRQQHQRQKDTPRPQEPLFRGGAHVFPSLSS